MATIINGDGIVTVEGTSTTQGRVRLNEDTDNGTNYVELQAPANVPSTVTFTLPSADGTNGQIIQTNGSGVLTFANAASLATPLTVTGNSTAGAEIRLPEDTDNGSNYVALKAADNLASNVTFTLPSADGTNGQVLQTNASGTLSFANLAVANGGTGQTSLTSNNVILGNGTSAVNFVAPGTNGNVLTSNGTTWTSAAGTSFATPLAVVGNSTAGAELRLPEDTDNGSNYVALKAPDNLASNLTFTLPSADGTNGQVLQTNGSGTLSFATPSSGAVLLASVSGTNASSFAFDTVFSATYDQYLAVVDLTVSGTNRLDWRTRRGGSYQTTGYKYYIGYAASSTFNFISSSNEAYGANTYTTNAGRMVLNIVITNANSSSREFTVIATGICDNFVQWSGSYQTALATTQGIAFYINSGFGTATGNIKIYGLANS